MLSFLRSLRGSRRPSFNPPEELCGLIAKELRDLDSANFREKTKEQWHSENKNLIALSLVSKTWRDEALPVLWSELFLDAGAASAVVGDHVDHGPIIKKYAAMLELAKGNGSTRSFVHFAKRLSITLDNVFWDGTANEKLTASIKGILSLAPRLQCLRIAPRSFQHTSEDIIQYLPQLHFPNLTTLYVEDRKHNDASEEALETFLRNHTTLENLTLRLAENSIIDLAYVEDIVEWPNLERFEGLLSHALALSQNSIPKLKELYILATELGDVRPALDATNLRAIAQRFPALETLNGLAMSPLFVSYMDAEEKRTCLPKLRELILYESVTDGVSVLNGVRYAELSDAEVDRTLNSLPRIFPDIFYVVVCKSAVTRRPRLLINRTKTIKLFDAPEGTELLLTLA
ncbi:hypothetical protein SISSUDRAFT_1122178 [Sistotremastrum suecicum HHB10207 ss-3]|uniref:F-box domain-containing protein n=1 Tax=Sistotremastrum suecicum HHB10207 ss-3 TaxID=1314776 RepID=A0A165ZQL9_9AGAM|nr:hypothetical protein SISSUDRAFT_1122178 [Sistotremastrum suecicum HHB10207 ss-3]